MGLTEPVRVVRIFSRLNIGGPSIHVVLLSAGLAARGYRTRLVIGQETAAEGNMLDLVRARGIDCVLLPELGREIRPWADLRALVSLLRLMRAFRPAVVHTHAAKAGLLGRVAARLARVPVVVHTYHGHVLRGYFGAVQTRLFRMAERALGASSDVVVAVSDSVRDELVTMGIAPTRKIRVVPLGLELEPLTGELPKGALRGPSRVAEGAPLVGIVGRLVPIKDVGTFLRAAALVRASVPEARFAVVGDGDERARLEDLSRELGLEDAVLFHGWRRDMAAVYGDLDVVVNCSLNEGTPVALIEALAAGRPVVATRVGGTPDVLRGGAHGILVAPGDPRALADAVVETLRDPTLAQARALEGRRWVLGHHAVTRLVDDVDRLYRELLGARGTA